MTKRNLLCHFDDIDTGETPLVYELIDGLRKKVPEITAKKEAELPSNCVHKRDRLCAKTQISHQNLTERLKLELQTLRRVTPSRLSFNFFIIMKSGRRRTKPAQDPSSRHSFKNIIMNSGRGAGAALNRLHNQNFYY